MKTLKFPAVFDGVSTKKDGSCTLRIATQELTREEKVDLMEAVSQFGWFLFRPSEKMIEEDEIPDDDPDSYDVAKSPSQRLRAVIWLLAKKKEIKPENFNQFYVGLMEKIIDHYKGKL